MEEWKWLIENVPVAAALIIMTRMWLTFLRDRDAETMETLRRISDQCHGVQRESTAAIGEVTEVLAGLKTLVEGRKKET